MNAMPLAALLFSAIACGFVALAGRRDGGPRLTALAIVLLLAFPLLSFLPKLEVLPAAAGSAPSPAAEGLPWATLLWAAGSLLLLARLGGSMLALNRWRRKSRPLTELDLGAGRSAEIRLHPELEGPVAAGILRPTVFVPTAWSDWDDTTRRMVLAHECSHLSRRDPLWRALGSLACALHWFNPFVWWLARRHALQSEYACDAQVLRSGIDPRRYARLLCDLADAGRPPSPALAMAEKSELRSRVERLLAPPGSISPALTVFLVVSTVLAALTASLLRRAEPTPAATPVPAEEVHLRLSADPFPGNP